MIHDGDVDSDDDDCIDSSDNDNNFDLNSRF
jgi:hypothetical protein